MKVFAIGVIVASLVLIMLYPTPAGGLEGQRYEGNVENYTLFAGKWDHPCI